MIVCEGGLKPGPCVWFQIRQVANLTYSQQGLLSQQHKFLRGFAGNFSLLAHNEYCDSATGSASGVPFIGRLSCSFQDI